MIKILKRQLPVLCCYIIILLLYVMIQADNENNRPSTLPDSKQYDATLNKIAAPGAKPGDLAWDGKCLLIADDSTEIVYRVDPTTGKVVSSLNVAPLNPFGLAWDGASLRVYDGTTNRILHLEPNTGEVLSSVDVLIASPKDERCSLTGLACDGKDLWIGYIAGWSSKMIKLEGSTGSIVKTYFTKGFPRAIAVNDDYLWSATDNGGLRPGTIYKYDITNGSFISQIDTPGDNPVGLTYDGKFLWCLDKATKIIYRLKAE
jgi:glutamine cyclotransferase